MPESAAAETIKAIVADALERPRDERGAFLDDACAGDAPLRSRVEALLALAEDADSFLDTAPTVDLSSSATHTISPHPSQVGDYAIRRCIGVGGAGTVYEAEQKSPHRTIALKLLSSGAVSESMLKRFERESEVLASLQHPNIAHIYESGVHGSDELATPYIAMELVREAQTLVHYAKSQNLDTTQRLELFIEVCKAVQHGHDRGIVHRDLKPANLLVDATGLVKVIDFGVARVIQDVDQLDRTRDTAMGDIVGTLPYMSPEQCLGDPESIDVRSDVYSLGVVLFELLAGRLPIELAGLSLEKVLQAIRMRPAARLAQIRPEMTDLDAITAKALRKDPNKRYESVAAMAADIQRHLDHRPVTARPPSMAYYVTLFARRNRAAVTIGLFAAIGLLGAAITSTVFAVQANELARTEAKQRFNFERLNTHLLSMLAMPDPHRRGGDATVLDMLEEMTKRLDGLVNEPPEIEASIRTSIGETYLTLQIFDSAEEQLTKAVALYRSIEDLPFGLIDALALLGQVHELQGDFATTERLYAEALAVRKSMPGATEADLLPLTGRLATTLIRQNKLVEAEPLTREVIRQEIAARGRVSIIVAAALRRLGRLQTSLEDFDQAEQTLRESLEISRQLADDDHPIIAATIVELGQAQMGAKAFAQARETLAEAWKLTSDARPVGSSDWMSCLSKYIECLLAAGDRPMADQVLRAAVSELTKRHDAGSVEVAGVLGIVAVHYDTHNHPDAARMIRSGEVDRLDSSN